MQTITPIVDVLSLHAALARWCDAMEAAAPELNALDGRLGDGDLGATLSKCAGNVRELLAAPPTSLETTLKSCAQACARASGSSFGTLLAVGFLQAARMAATHQALGRDELVDVLTGVQQALSQRGGAALGDKTMLDSIAFMTLALKVCESEAGPQALKEAASRGAQQALDELRQQPNRIGRARMFAERSIGMDDPGMVAVRRMTQAL
jgi:dihydroxyacetone kinase-like protein